MQKGPFQLILLVPLKGGNVDIGVNIVVGIPASNDYFNSSGDDRIFLLLIIE